MNISSDGFLRPIQKFQLSQEQEEAISTVCPALGYSQDCDTQNEHPLWGPVQGIYQGYATDKSVRYKASSGGGLSAILAHLIETRAVDYILQTEADSEFPIGNRNTLSSDYVAISKASGSRYAPSAPLSDIAQFLNSNSKYAFVGKPCDIAALRAMGKNDPRVQERFPYMLSFFCAGVPSLIGARKILEALEVEESEVTSFRYRGNGWPGYATVECRDGSNKQMSYTMSWGGILSKYLQLRCKLCPDGTGGLADIVCADAWEADGRGYPLFSERPGVSLIVGRTTKGNSVIKQAAAAKKISISTFDINKLANIQPGQTQKRRYTLSRILALNTLRRPRPSFKGFYLFKNAASAGVWPNVKNFLGVFRRAIQGKL
ncbi:MAG: Coenzyme F420 hydrogenase/dehydrogenase, beta subunit C-terminal domain [Pseudomonadota bacterium]